MRQVVAVLCFLLLAGTASATCEDTGAPAEPDEDCDGDGWTRLEGDCDDFEASVNPGREEQCDDSFDNDCNGYFNDGCENALDRGSLSGGSTCSMGMTLGGAGLWLPVLLVGAARRRA